VEPATTQKTERHWHIWRLASINTAVFKRIQRRPACTTQFLHWFLGSRHPTLYKKKRKKKTRIRKKKPSGNGKPTKRSKPGCGLSCLPWTSFRLLWFEFLWLVSSMAGQPPTMEATTALKTSHRGSPPAWPTLSEKQLA